MATTRDWNNYLYFKVEGMIRLIFLLVIISYSCSPKAVPVDTPSAMPLNTYSQDSLYIQLTGGFKNDSLVIEYADSQIIIADITTGANGFAREFVIPDKGTDKILFNLIRPGNRYTAEIINKGDNFIEVWYCKDDVLKHHSRTEPLIYK